MAEKQDPGQANTVVCQNAVERFVGTLSDEAESPQRRYRNMAFSNALFQKELKRVANEARTARKASQSEE